MSSDIRQMPPRGPLGRMGEGAPGTAQQRRARLCDGAPPPGAGLRAPSQGRPPVTAQIPPMQRREPAAAPGGMPPAARQTATKQDVAVADIAPDKRTLSPGGRVIWNILQAALLLFGVVLVGLLVFWPEVGIKVMWDVLIPAAPFLVTVAPGLWRNICPMATFGLLPRRFGFSLQVIMPRNCTAVLGVLSMVALFLIVPLRHVMLNTNGPATAIMLVTAAMIAFTMGMVFEWRSGWCTSLCPIHPVEKLYGTSPAIQFKNARCTACQMCTKPCPDSTAGMNPALTGPTWTEMMTGRVLAASFFGFVVGWFQVPDYTGPVTWPIVIESYVWPFGCAIASYGLFKAGDMWFDESPEVRRIMTRVFATGAVSTYYWYRIPALVGMGPFYDSGMLIDLSQTLPYWFPYASHAVTTAFFFWFLVIRPTSERSWLVRPKPAKAQNTARPAALAAAAAE